MISANGKKYDYRRKDTSGAQRQLLEARAELHRLSQDLGIGDYQRRFYIDQVPSCKSVLIIGTNDYAVVTHAGDGVVFYGSPVQYPAGTDMEMFLQQQRKEKDVIGFVPMTVRARDLLEREGIDSYL